MESITITPLRRQVQGRAEIRPLPAPRSLPAQLHVQALRSLAKVAPAFTLDVLYDKYFTPPRYRPSQGELAILANADLVKRDVLGRRLAIYEWGATPDFPWERAPERTALLVHGWGGAAAQMTAFVEPLRKAGYRVRAFDWPAHGRSRGERTTVAEAARIVGELATARDRSSDDPKPGSLAGRAIRPLIVGHSLGGSAALVAAARGLDAEGFVLVAAGARLDRYPLRFARAVGMSDAMGEALRRRLVSEFGEDVLQPGFAPALDRALSTPTLLVHDIDDAEMPHDDSRALAARFRSATLISTAGLGHRRILKDPPVLEEVARFVCSLG